MMKEMEYLMHLRLEFYSESGNKANSEKIIRTQKDHERKIWAAFWNSWIVIFMIQKEF